MRKPSVVTRRLAIFVLIYPGYSFSGCSSAIALSGLPVFLLRLSQWKALAGCRQAAPRLLPGSAGSLKYPLIAIFSGSLALRKGPNTINGAILAATKSA
jgi:hypothetical protein